MKKVYVVTLYPNGEKPPDMFVFGSRSMAETFVREMIRDGTKGEDINVKQYLVMTESQLQGHYGVKSDA